MLLCKGEFGSSCLERKFGERGFVKRGERRCEGGGARRKSNEASGD